MHRIALDFVLPGMTLARDIYDQDGTVMISAGMKLTEGIIIRLRSRGVFSVYVHNPIVDLPVLSPDHQHIAILETRAMVEQAFATIRQAGRILLSAAEDQIIHEVVNSVLDNPVAALHTAHIHRHSRDLMSHSVQVALLSTLTAAAMGISDRPSLYEIAAGSLLHDIGKVMIPSDLLVRSHSLTSEEELLYREHTRWGYTILSRASDLPISIARVALEHHEHVDGSGYPENLYHEAMLPAARIIAVTNAYERLFSEVSFRNGNDHYRAFEAIQNGAGTLFDLEPSRALLSQIPKYPNGTLVELNNSFIGAVTFTKNNFQHRPIIEIIYNPEGLAVDPPYTLDLSDIDRQHLFIKTVLDDERAAQILAVNSE